MPYKNRAKQKEYQRDWVRHKRSKGSTKPIATVEPDVEPSTYLEIEPQNYNPMMVGYVPPTGD